MKIALFLRDEKMKAFNMKAVRVLVCNMMNDSIADLEENSIPSLNINYVSLWMLNKEINVIYIPEEQPDATEFFKKIDISVKTYDDIQTNSVLRPFIV